MTTEEKFFDKIFTEGEKAKGIYKNYDFDFLSQNEKNFLRRLTFISKYKETLKRLLFSRKVKTRDQVSYIETYKQNLDYKYHIQFEQALSYKSDLKQLTLSFISFGTIASFAFFLIRKDPSKGVFKECFLCFLAFCGMGNMFYNLSLRKNNEIVNTVYKTLENEINTNMEFKKGKVDPNFYTENDDIY